MRWMLTMRDSIGITSPLNTLVSSLIEEDLSFDAMGRPPPTITEETTHSLEDIIRQRIKDEVRMYWKFSSNYIR